MTRALPLAVSISLCLASIAATGCDRRPTGNPQSCPKACQKCDESFVCRDCQPPGADYCNGDVVQACNADGTIGEVVKTCDALNGAKCVNGNCQTPCDVAASTRSYIGCDYWPVPLLNAQLDPLFDFAVVVANPLQVGDVVTSGPAKVKVVRGSAPCDTNGDLSDGVAFATVSPGQVKTLLLPWIEEISQNSRFETSVQAADAAYHLCSSLPVTVYQFNPLQFEKPAARCSGANPPVNGMCRSYTNDASILLPSTALMKKYIVASRQTYGIQQRPTPQVSKPAAGATPGFFTIVATQNNTKVTVKYAGYAGGGVNLDDMKPGDVGSYELAAGEVLQIVSGRAKWDPLNSKPPCANFSEDFQAKYCDFGKAYDLTGSIIESDRPIAVFGGHSCTFVPYNKWACDHIEEQLIPLDTWGAETLAVQTPPTQAKEPNVFRIISGSRDTLVTLDPPLVMPQTLNEGEWFEVMTTGGFYVKATTTDMSQPRVLVSQYMVGQNFNDQFFGEGVGDPAMSLAVPIEQYRKRYEFLTPQTYTKSFVTVIGRAGQAFKIDDMDRMIGFNQPIGATDYGWEFIELASGAHRIESDEPCGINVSGLAAFTSYAFPGGLNLLEIAPQ